MAKQNRKRRRTLGLTAFSAVLVLAAAMPLWWPWLLRPLLASQGIRFGSYERAGYSRTILHAVHWERLGLNVTAESLEAALPGTWLWQKWSGPASAGSLVSVRAWRLELTRDLESESSESSLHAVLGDVDAALLTVRRWLPSASATNGVIQTGTNEFHIHAATWQQGHLTVAASAPPHLPETQVGVTFRPSSPKHTLATITVQAPALKLECGSHLSRTSEELVVEGFILWQSNRAELTARFGKAGWLPHTASVRCPALELSTPAHPLAGYEILRGGLEARWQSNQFAVELTAQAESSCTNIVPLQSTEARLRVSGDVQTVRLEEARFNTRGLRAELVRTVTGGFTRESWRDVPALWRISAALDQQPWLALTGNVTGEITAKLSDSLRPEMDFALSSPEARGYDLAVTNLTARGRLNWPLMRLDTFRAHIVDGPHVIAQGEVDLEQNHVLAAEVELRGPVSPALLSAGFVAESLVLTGRASGPFAELAHAGHMTVIGLARSNLPSLSGEIGWRGTALAVDAAKIQAQWAEWTLQLGAALTARAGKFTGGLTEGSVARSNQPLAALIAPVGFVVGPKGTGDTWPVRVDDLHARGPAGEIRFHAETSWPRTGRMHLAASGVELHRWWQMDERWRDAQLERCELEATWDNGPVEFNLGMQARLSNATNALRTEVTLQGGPDGVQIRQAQVFDSTGPALTARGVVPVTFDPARAESGWHTPPDAALDFEMSAARGAQFWEALASWTGVRLQSPEVTLSLRGTLSNPQGRLHARAAAAEFPVTHRLLPQVERLEAQLELSRTHIALTHFAARVENQPLRATGELPLTEDFWQHPTDRTTWPGWEQARGRFTVPAANVSAFARFLPDLLSPQGTVNLDLEVRPGAMLHGELTLADAATRGWLPMGPIREVRAQLQFEGRRASVNEFSGQLAGRTVNVTGHLDWPEWDKPGFALKLAGERVPLAREPGLILRGDVNLLLASTNSAPPHLSGDVRLRDSFYLAELRTLLPGRPESPQLRPPFFSIAEPPFGGWKLDVKLTGERGLRVRTPLFRGELSPDLRLDGTLREPRAVGEVRINEGRVQFPFASIGIAQSRILLASDNPYRPELFIKGTSRVFDYDVRLSATGFADAPVWEMSSDPPLSPEAIVLMVTAGEVPRDRVTFTERQRAGRLMFFLGKSLFSELWLDDTVGDRLIVRSGESVTSDGRETYSVEYILTDRWSLVGEYDRFNALNAGIKWRVYSK